MKIKKKSILIFLFIVILFILTRQVPFSNLSPIMNISLIVLVIFSLLFANGNKLNYKIQYITLYLLSVLVLHTFYSFLFSNSSIYNLFRFFTILFSLILAFHINNLPRKFLNIFFTLYAIQSFIVILSELIMLFIVDDFLAGQIRTFVIEKGWGDVYSNGQFFHIQIKGNALLPFAFMLLFIEQVKIKFKGPLKLLFLSATIFSGNFAFLIALTIFLIINIFINLKNNNDLYRKLVLFSMIIVFLSPFLYRYVINKIDLKNEGNSILERTEQTKYLLQNLTQNPSTFLLGTGLGSTLNIISPTRDYRGATYFEIQPLYFLSQMGIIFFGMFVFYNFLVAYLNFKNKKLLLIFFIYWIYASINPYIFDTNHFIVIIILNTIQNYKQGYQIRKLLTQNNLIYDYHRQAY